MLKGANFDIEPNAISSPSGNDITKVNAKSITDDMKPVKSVEETSKKTSIY